MKSVIAQNASDVEMVNQLLIKEVPNYRQAYSDRTSWLMACFSELAYLRFNPVFNNEQQKDLITKHLEKYVENSKKANIVKLLDVIAYDHEAELNRLKTELSLLNAKLVKTFDSNGTQAILVSTDKFITLAFRGTEATSVKDIKADTKATTVKCDSGGNIHSGFKEAFEEVELEIQRTLNQPQFVDKPLFITGHSLGGALATIAAKKLYHTGGIASCYTFGAPRVGDDVWISNIKVPFYRVVNAADCVTMMPPSSVTISMASWIIGFIPQVGKNIRSYILAKFGGYLHGGNMRYLTNCTNGNFATASLLYSVSFFYRIKMLYMNALPWSKSLADHSISLYRKKLAIIGIKRNLDN